MEASAGRSPEFASLVASLMEGPDVPLELDIHPAAFAVIFGGEKGDCFRELYDMAGMHGIPQLHDDGSCFDAAWLRLMEAHGVLWFLCCWHFWFKMVPKSIKSWHPREPKLCDAVRILQLKVFPEGEDDVDIDTRVDEELRN